MKRITREMLLPPLCWPRHSRSPAVSTAAAAPAVNGTFLVPGVETNNKIVAGPDGNMWVTVATGERTTSRASRRAGEVKEFELKGSKSASGIAVGPKAISG